MKKKRLLFGLLSLMIAAAMAVFGCRKKEPDAAPPAPAEPSAEQPAQQESQPKAEQTEPEPEKPFMEQMTPVEVAINTNGLKIMGGMMNYAMEKNTQSVVIDQDADIVFPKEIGGFSLSYIAVPDIGGYVNDGKRKRPVSISYDSEELKSSVSILIEQIPLEVTGVQMDLSSCQNRMQEMVKQVSMGKPPMALYDKANESRISQMFGNGNNRGTGLQINEPSPESKLETSSTPFRSVSWTWRIPNGRSRQYLIQDKGIHGAEMFWNIARRYGHTVGYLGQIDNPAAEQQYSLTSLLMLKNDCLVTVIIQSEGGEATENNAKAVEAFTASLDKDVLPSSCRGYYDRQDEKYEKSAWSTMGGKPLPFYAALKKDAPQDVISDCISSLDMAGKSFGEICGVDYDTKLNYGRYDDSSRLADALQYLILYIKEYGTLPPSVRKPLEIVFKGANRHVDADALLAAFGSKSEAKPEEAEALAAKERILRGKILLRLRQVQRITRVIANDRQRRINALEREIDPKRTANLEAYIQQLQSNASNQNFNQNTSEARKQVMDAINHVIEEFKSGKVSTRLNVTPPNQNNYGGNFTLGSVLANFAGRFGVNTSSIQTELAKTAFDLGDDSLAISMLQFYGNNGFNADDLLSYMFSNGFGGFVDNYRGNSRDQQLWNSPRMSHLMILSNYPIPGYILSNLITQGKIDIVRELLFADAPVNELSNGQLPLAIAIQSGNTELEQLLLANGANKELKDGNGKTPEDYRIYGTFWKALNSKDYKTQKECLAKGMNVNQTTPNSSWRFIDIAIEKKDTEAAKMLLEAGADPAYNNIISRAYQSGQIEIFRLLLKHGAPLEQNGQHLLCTVLQPNYNAQANATEFLKEVIAKMDKAKLNEEICKYNEQTRMTPACYAIFVANTGNDNASAQLLQKLKLLEEAGADITKTPTPNSLPPLFFAVFKRQATVDLYSYLLSKGADVNSVTVPKSTEISNNEWRLGNEISAKGVEKTGILTFAARHWAKTRYIDNNFLNNALPYLVEKGAKADVKDSYGKTAIDYLEELKGRNKHYAELLQTKFQTLGLIK